MLMLAVMRNFGPVEQSARDGEFATGRFLAAPGPELYGSAVGLLGFGHIGQAVAARLTPFGARVAYTARHRVDPAIEERLSVGYATFDEILEGSTILSLHLPLSDATRGLIGENELHRMPVGSFLVNTSRGGIVDEGALRSALESGHLAGAALDVLERETGAGNPFADLPQALVTPHLAGSSQKSFPRAGQMCAANIIRFLAGEELVNPISNRR
jgi:phosphoglycerate dehydrogenase-like enzyme